MQPATLQRREPTDDGQQLQLLTQFPVQLIYELIRPVVLYGTRQPSGHAKPARRNARSIGRLRFKQQGMTSLFPPTPPAPRQALPPEIREATRELKG